MDGSIAVSMRHIGLSVISTFLHLRKKIVQKYTFAYLCTARLRKIKMYKSIEAATNAIKGIETINALYKKKPKKINIFLAFQSVMK